MTPHEQAARKDSSAFLHKPTQDADLEAEIAAHLEMAIEENLARGMSPAEARRLAMIQFGGMDVAKSSIGRREGL